MGPTVWIYSIGPEEHCEPALEEDPDDVPTEGIKH